MVEHRSTSIEGGYVIVLTMRRRLRSPRDCAAQRAAVCKAALHRSGIAKAIDGVQDYRGIASGIARGIAKRQRSSEAFVRCSGHD